MTTVRLPHATKLPRILGAFALLMLTSLTACGDSENEDALIPVDESALESTTTGVASDSTTSITPLTTGDASTTTESPNPTQPYTTAPPSELLTEVDAAYTAAQRVGDESAIALDENYPGLTDYTADPMLEKSRELIRGWIIDGIVPTRSEDQVSWHRVEGLNEISPTKVVLEVCGFSAVDGRALDGSMIDKAGGRYRYLETMNKVEGVWKWAAREWVDPPDGPGDCAAQQ